MTSLYAPGVVRYGPKCQNMTSSLVPRFGHYSAANGKYQFPKAPVGAY